MSNQPAYFAHASVFHHQGKPVPIELSIATILRDGSDPKLLCITVDQEDLTFTPKDMRSNACKNARLRLVPPLPKSVPAQLLLYCVRGMFNELSQGNRGLMVVKSPKQQKIFKELGLSTMSLEMLLKFKNICVGTYSNPMHEDLHEEGDVSHCTMLKSFQYAKYLQRFNKLQEKWSSKVSALAK